MSYSPNVYNTTIPAGITGTGIYNLAPIAYGAVIQNTGLSGLTGAYNSILTSNAGNNTQIIIINPTTYNNYIPLVSSTQPPNNVTASMSSTTINVNGFAATGSGQNTNFTYIVFGN